MINQSAQAIELMPTPPDSPVVGVALVRQRLADTIGPGWRTCHLVPADTVLTVGTTARLAVGVFALCGTRLEPDNASVLDSPIPFVCQECLARVDWSAVPVHPARPVDIDSRPGPG